MGAKKLSTGRKLSTWGVAEARAYADKRYTTHLDALQGAIERDEYHRWMMVAAQAKIEAWRTQCANVRIWDKIR